MVNFENVSEYGLNDVCIHVPKGEIVGLIGASGAGKTTMIKLACGLLKPDKGRVYTLGKDPFLNRKLYNRKVCPPPLRRRFPYLRSAEVQAPAERKALKNAVSTFITGTPLLCREDTVVQGFELIRNMYGISKTDFARRYKELSERLDFGRCQHQPVKNLSLGQRMRAELGAALIYEPELLLLDEPNVGLDENGKTVLCELLTERCKNGMSVLMTSHDMAGVSRMCGRIALLDGGRLIFYGSENNLRSRYAPIDIMTLKFSGNIPDFEDLPLKKYSVQGNTITLSYNSNHITSAEILKLILGQTSVLEVGIRKPNLESIISQLKSEG